MKITSSVVFCHRGIDHDRKLKQYATFTVFSNRVGDFSDLSGLQGSGFFGFLNPSERKLKNCAHPVRLVLVRFPFWLLAGVKGQGEISLEGCSDFLGGVGERDHNRWFWTSQASVGGVTDLWKLHRVGDVFEFLLKEVHKEVSRIKKNGSHSLVKAV